MGLTLFAFLAIAWFFTDLHRRLSLLSPRRVFEWMPATFFVDGHFRPALVVTLTEVAHPERSLQLLLGLLAGAFLCVYLAPVRWKRTLIVLWFLPSAALLLGVRATAGLLAAHLFIYLVFHPRGPGARWIAGGGAALVTLLSVTSADTDPAREALACAASPAVGLGAATLHAQRLAAWLSRPEPARTLRLLATHLPPVALLTGTLLGLLKGSPLLAPLGLVLLFWHYMRLLMYGIDVADGAVPEDLPLPIYLSVFLSPATLNSWPEGISIAQGYSYQTERFLSREKNELVLRGLGLLSIGVGYMALGPFVVASLAELAGRFGVEAYAEIPRLLQIHLVARDAAPSTVLVTSLLDHLHWIFVLGGMFHFKVGIWRLLGYDVDPYLRFPLLATNLVTLWTRLTFHWKEVLVRGFYYPVFLRLASWPLWARTLFATAVAAGFANWLWAHATELLIWNGMTTGSLGKALRMWPYFFFLATGIGIAQLWVTWRGRRRKAWSFDRWILTDVVAAYVTTQFYALIHVFYYGEYMEHGAAADYWVMFLRAFGLA